MVNIYSSKNVLKATVDINEGAKGRYTLGGEDYIILPFNVAEPIVFAIGDWCDLSGLNPEELGGKFAKRYEVSEIPSPAYDEATGGYHYDLRMDAYYYSWKWKLFKYIPLTGGKETSWSLTRELSVHMDVFLRNLEEEGFTYLGESYIYVIDSSVENKAVNISYNSTSLIGALAMMAEAFKCEWWVTGKEIHFGRLEFGDAVDIRVGIEASAITRAESSGKYATRVYVFGADRNLPRNYRPVTSDITVNGIVQKRLMLPEGTPYIDAYRYRADGATRVYVNEDGYDDASNIEMSKAEALEAVAVNDEIYPKIESEVESVGFYEKEVEDEDTGEGTGEFEKFYYVTTDGFTFTEEYILPEVELEIKFTSGKLNGMTFGCKFRPEGSSAGEVMFASDSYEIVSNSNYGERLPNDLLKPEEGNTFVLLGWDSTRIEDLGLVREAEDELKEYGVEYVSKTMVDDGTYTTTLASDWVYKDRISHSYNAGQRMLLSAPAFFETPRQSRVLGYEMCLDLPYDSPQYIIGESVQYSRISNIESQIDDIVFNGVSYQGGGGNGSNIYLIKNNDSTAPTEFNAYSASRALRQFLRKDRSDSTSHDLGAKNLAAKEKVTARELLTEAFSQGLLGGTGGGVWLDEQGKSHGEVDYLSVRMKAVFAALEINKTLYTAGDLVLGCAGNTILRVEPIIGSGENAVPAAMENATAYRCYFRIDDGETEVENMWRAGDQARCQTFNIKSGAYENVSNTFYWRLVLYAGADFVDLSATDCAPDSGIPKAGDDIAQLGHRTDTGRMNAIMLIVNGPDAPALIQYAGIDSYDLVGKEVTRLSPSGNLLTGKVEMKSGSTISREDGTTSALEEELDKASRAYKEELDVYKQEVTRNLEEIQSQIDGSIDTWFGEDIPTLENHPADQWNTEELKRAHLDDLYYLDTGKAYRFQYDNSSSTFLWVEIVDSALVEALEIAKKAQDTADGKRTIFVARPTVPYQRGDLWVNATITIDGVSYDNDILRASESSDVFVDTHWVPASKYTDDTKANEAIEKIDNLEVGGGNLLRNTGFTGDYLSEQLADDKVLDTASQMYSPPLDHWNYTSGIAVIEVESSASGYGVEFSSECVMSQNAYFDLVRNETHMVSFKARSTSSNSRLSVSVGGNTDIIILDGNWQRYAVPATPASGNLFSLSGSSLQICEIQLEKGNKATAWKPSYLDNASDRAYWQSVKYLQSAVRDSSTVVNGGLVLSSVIAVGEHIDKNTGTDAVTGGMSGILNDTNIDDVAFWSGGTFEQAIAAMMKHLDNPAFRPSDSELAQMAKFVVTHGGRAILNDVIARGVIYATSGVFRGTVYASDGEFSGTVNATSGVFRGTVEATSGHVGGFTISGDAIGNQEEGVMLSSGAIMLAGESRYILLNSNADTLGRMEIRRDNARNVGMDFSLYGSGVNIGVNSNAPLVAPSFVGTNAQVVEVSGATTVKFRGNPLFVVINKSGSVSDVSLPESSDIGAFLGGLPSDFAMTMTIVMHHSSTANVKMKSSSPIYNHNGGAVTEYTMDKGDSMTFLASNIGGFHYQMINRTE